MSALTFKLLLYLCVYPGVLYANGLKNVRYSPRFDSNWRLGKRQDLLAQSRYFMWKPPINPIHQLQSSVKAPIIPYNFNRYGIVPPAAPMAPILQNYMFTMPTKVNYPLYQKSIQDMHEKRKPGNLHHITIINAIMPKPYLPTLPTYAHPTTTFRNYRTNNKFLHQQHLNHFARQNMEHFNNVNAQPKLQPQQQQEQQQQFQKPQMKYPLNIYALNTNKPTMDLTNLLSYNTMYNNNSSMELNGVNNMKSESVAACGGRRDKDDSNNSASDIMYYYCNNRITNYKNPTQYEIVSTQTTTTAAPTTTSTTSTTTERPSTTTARIIRTSFDYFTTEKPIFLPTPIEPLETHNVPAASLTNSVVNTESEGNLNYREDFSSKQYEDIRSELSSQYQPRKTLTRYDDFRRKQQQQHQQQQQQQQQYTTAAVYDNMKLHSFFTLEDAVTKAPEMQVFNDPYQAYRHARRHHYSHQRQTTTPIATTPTTTTTTMKPKYKSFFDDLEDEDYATSKVHNYDYSFFGTPQKSIYEKPVYRSEQKYTQPNRIIDQTYRTIDDNSYFTESYEGKPKVKEHHFGLFKAISPTPYTAPPITTYKPYDNFKENTLTTHKIPHTFSSYRSKSLPATTTEIIIKSHKETDTTTTDLYPIQTRTSTITPITTTEKRTNKIKLKSPLTLKTPTTYKYPKQRGIKKPYKILTSTTTTKATPTLKKIPKYQRQYKVKKLKQFKHLFTTTSTTSTTSTTTTTTTGMPLTTVENYTKRASSKIFPITSTTEEPTTRKIPSRTITTTDGPKARKSTRRKHVSTTEPANTRKKTITRLLVQSTIASENTSTRKQSTRRGSKRANKTRTEKDVSSTTTATPRRNVSKSRRIATTTSTTPKPDVKRSTLSITLTTSSAAPPIRSTSSSTTTTMRSIMRIANSKLRSRSQTQNELKSSLKTYNDIHDAEYGTLDNRGSFKSITSTGASIPPLPIEIYFKKSQNAKI